MTTLVQSGPAALFFAFAIAHALADYPLQGDYLAREKIRKLAESRASWAIALTAHALIHAGGAWAVSGVMWIGVAELCLHWLIDWGKGEGKFGLVADQSLHLGCKAAYVAVLSV